MLAALRQSGGLNALARQLGAGAPEIALAVESVLPGLLTKFRNFERGFPKLIDVLGELGGSSLAVAVMDHEHADPAPGLAVLEFLDCADAPCANGNSHEIDAGLQHRMLPLLAMLVGGYLAARAAVTGLSSPELANLLQPDPMRPPPSDEPV